MRGQGAGVGAGLLLSTCLSKSDSEAAGPPSDGENQRRVQLGSITVGVVNRWELTEPQVGQDPQG